MDQQPGKSWRKTFFLSFFIFAFLVFWFFFVFTSGRSCFVFSVLFSFFHLFKKKEKKMATSHSVKRVGKVHVHHKGGRRMYFINAALQALHTVEHLMPGDFEVEQHVKDSSMLSGLMVLHHDYKKSQLADLDHESVKVYFRERFRIKVDGSTSGSDKEQRRSNNDCENEFDIGFVSPLPHTVKTYSDRGAVVAVHLIFITKQHHEDAAVTPAMYPPLFAPAPPVPVSVPAPYMLAPPVYAAYPTQQAPPPPLSAASQATTLNPSAPPSST
jgi:hypothetical protein